MPRRIKSYEFNLPVFKQGDDLAYNIEQTPNLAEAFTAAAKQYEEAATMCKRMAGIAAETKQMEVDADTHMITIIVPEKDVPRFDALVKEEFIYESHLWDEEDFEDEEEYDD